MGSGDGPDEVGVPRRAADAQGLRRGGGLVRFHRDQLDGQQLPGDVVERLRPPLAGPPRPANAAVAGRGGAGRGGRGFISCVYICRPADPKRI